MMKYEPNSKLGITEIELLMMPFHDLSVEDVEPDWQTIDAVNEALASLTEQERWVLYRIFYDKITYEELANNLGIKAKSHAWLKVQNALENLKNEILKNPLFEKLKENDRPERTKKVINFPQERSDKNGSTKG